MKPRVLLFIIALFATSASLSAQTSDVTVWITDSELHDPSITEDGETAKFDTDEKVGYGLSFNHYWTNAFSTEVAYHKFGGDLSISIEDGPLFELGELDASSLSGVAQWHFRRGTRFSPYIGAGVAYVQGDFNVADPDVDDEENFDFDSETTWVLNAGADIALTDRLAIALDAKYVQWEPRAENDETGERIDLSPVLLSAGLRLRF